MPQNASVSPSSEKPRSLAQRLLDSWCLLPLLHALPFWGLFVVFFHLSKQETSMGFFPVLAPWALYGLCTALLLPLPVLVQVLRSQWKTVWKTALLSALLLLPSVCLIFDFFRVVDAAITIIPVN